MYFIALLADGLISQLACAYFVKVGSAVLVSSQASWLYSLGTHTSAEILSAAGLHVCNLSGCRGHTYVRDRAVLEVCLGTIVLYHHGNPLPRAMVNQDSLIAFPPSPQSACLWCTLAVTCPHMPTLCTYSCL